MERNKRIVKQTMGDGDGNTQIGEQNNYYTYQKKEAVVQECHERYRNDWNKKMFLTRDISLRKLYRLPYYEEYKKENCSLYQRLKNVLKNSDDFSQRMLLILGQPGSGKTALMSYVLNHYSDELTGRIVRMYSFRSFTRIDWNNEPENLFREMLNDMGLEREDLNNSVLILDGLDEVRMSDKQEQFLNFIYSDWITSNTIKKFSLLVTCRINRISDTDDLDCPYIHLRPFSKKQIVKFVKKYNKYDSDSINKLKNIIQVLEGNNTVKEVLGIPLILYMILALGIELDKESNLVEIYDKIFSVDGKNSIYQHANYNYRQDHNVTGKINKPIHRFSKEIAMEMWKDENKQAVVKRDDYERIVEDIALSITENEIMDIDVRDLLIGQYFVEGKDSCELYFVHRSMYQYFVALSIFDAIQDMMSKGSPSDKIKELQNNFCTLKDSKQKNPEITSFAEIIGIDLIYEDPDIEQYLLYMIKNKPIKDNQWWKDNECWKSFFACFLDQGLTRYVDDYKESTLECFDKELNRFYNLIWLTREQLIRVDSSQLYYNVAEVDEKLCFYLRQRQRRRVDLSGVDLIGADISEAGLSEADMSGAVLIGADLSGTNLAGTDIRGAYLIRTHIYGADLNRADLSGADLSGADLCGAVLYKADISEANLSEANLGGVNLSESYIRGANLRGAVLYKADIIEADLSVTDLRGANLYKSDLSRADLSEADLSGANLSGANLTDIFVDKEELRKAILDEENYKKFFEDESE